MPKGLVSIPTAEPPSLIYAAGTARKNRRDATDAENTAHW